MKKHPAVEITDLQFTYRNNGFQVLRGVNLRIEEGEKVALAGANGAGKSTLLLHLIGLLKGTGKVSIFGTRVDSASRKVLSQVRAMVGLVFDNPDNQLFSATVQEDVEFGPIHMGLPPEEISKRTHDALGAVKLRANAEKAPYELSAGQKRMAAIATVLSMQPRIIAADEPSANLDPRSKRALIELFRELPTTLLVATHDSDLIMAAFPRCLLMNAGRIIADGSARDILNDSVLLEEAGL